MNNLPPGRFSARPSPLFACKISRPPRPEPHRHSPRPPKPAPPVLSRPRSQPSPPRRAPNPFGSPPPPPLPSYEPPDADRSRPPNFFSWIKELSPGPAKPRRELPPALYPPMAFFAGPIQRRRAVPLCELPGPAPFQRQRPSPLNFWGRMWIFRFSPVPPPFAYRITGFPSGVPPTGSIPPPKPSFVDRRGFWKAAQGRDPSDPPPEMPARPELVGIASALFNLSRRPPIYRAQVI